NLRKLFIPFELKLKPAIQSNLGTDYEFLEVCGIRSLPQFLKLQRTDRDLNEETLYELSWPNIRSPIGICCANVFAIQFRLCPVQSGAAECGENRRIEGISPRTFH